MATHLKPLQIARFSISRELALFRGSGRAIYERLLMGTVAGMIFCATLHPILMDRAAGNQVSALRNCGWNWEYDGASEK